MLPRFERQERFVTPHGIPPFLCGGHLVVALFLLQLAKGQMLGGVDGFLKLLFDTKTLKLLGVHAFGEGATEIIHIGQVSGGGGENYLCIAGE